MASRTDVLVVVTVALLVTACSSAPSTSSSPTGTNATTASLRVAMTAGGCAPLQLVTRPGLTRFDLSNRSGSGASFQVLSGDHVIGQVERLGAGRAASMSLDLTPGAYRTACQIGSTDHPGGLRVGGATSAVALGQAPDLLSAAAAYRAFLVAHTDALVASLTALRDSVAAGDQGGARVDYASARTSYGQVQPAADNFGDAEPDGLSNLALALDGPVDAGLGDPPRGLRLVEQGLWGSASVTSLEPDVAALLADAVALRSRVGAMHLDAVEFAGGSGTELSQSVATVASESAARPGSLDLVDLRAATDGARGVFDALHPALARRDASLDARVAQRLAQLDAAIDAAGSSLAPAGAGWSPALAAPVVNASDALADALAQVAPVLARPQSR